MAESYSDTDSGGTERPAIELTRALLAQLVPHADAELLREALVAERDAMPPTAERDRADRELARIRGLLALGESARATQHAMNNPLTALLAEAQMLEMEPLAEEQRAAVARMVALARRLAALSRGMDVSASARVG